MNKTVNSEIKEKIKLDRAYLNYHKVIDKNLPFKFAYLDEWLLKDSKKMLEEAELIESGTKMAYRVYKRGTIIKADFGVGLGSEMSQVHFAIVINKYDNPKNNVLTVVPLTSKESKFNLNLDNLVMDKEIKKLQSEITKIGFDEEMDNTVDLIKIKKLSTLLSYYKSNAKNTYACCNLLTTISKTRILPPINEYDIIGYERCSDEVMNQIDNELLRHFTGRQSNQND